MRHFLTNILKLFVLVVILLTFSLFCIPDVVSQNSILAALTDKHKLLEKAGSRKIVFVGGSNVSFGLDSKKIAEAFNEPVVNMGVHAGMGLEYTVNDVKPYVKRGDIIVLIPEYENFYTDNFYGEMELVSVLFDIDPAGKQFVTVAQWRHLLKYMPTYSAKKIKNYIPSLFHRQNPSQAVDIYSRYSFNDFGDAYIHWALPDQDYLPANKNTGHEKINPEVISFIKKFKAYVEEKDATLILFPPVIEAQSFYNQQNMVDSVNAGLKREGIPFMSEPLKYKFEENYFFNSYYHLNKSGVDLRTQLVIEDLKAVAAE